MGKFLEEDLSFLFTIFVLVKWVIIPCEVEGRQLHGF